jgi:hypothetical protein
VAPDSVANAAVAVTKIIFSPLQATELNVKQLDALQKIN